MPLKKRGTSRLKVKRFGRLTTELMLSKSTKEDAVEKHENDVCMREITNMF